MKKAELSVGQEVKLLVHSHSYSRKVNQIGGSDNVD